MSETAASIERSVTEFVESVREERASYEAEIARYREALEQIASHDHARISVANIANKALGKLK